MHGIILQPEYVSRKRLLTTAIHELLKTHVETKKRTTHNYYLLRWRSLLQLRRPAKLVLQILRLLSIGLLLQTHERIQRGARLFRLLLAPIELRQLVVRLAQRFCIGFPGVS